jgi:hypothetical protein
VALNEAGAELARFEFPNGAFRGSHLALHRSCLVHRADTHFETLPLASIAAVRVAYLRNARRVGWGIGLILIALVVSMVSSPLAAFAAEAAAEWAPNPPGSGGQGVAGVLHGTFRFFELVATLLPALAAALALGGTGLAALGWIGDTTLTVALAGSERAYSVRGRNGMLLEFAEALSERTVHNAAPPAS